MGILKWLFESIEGIYYLTAHHIEDYERYCTKCGKKYIVHETFPSGVFSSATGKEFTTYTVGCPYGHEKIYLSDNPKYKSYNY